MRLLFRRIFFGAGTAVIVPGAQVTFAGNVVTFNGQPVIYTV